MDNNGFSDFVNKVINCDIKNCTLNKLISMNNKPIQLDHENVNEVKILIITEQPKILWNKTEVTNKNFLFNVEDSSTVQNLKTILGEEFIKSVQERKGPYYWTHHTKCPSKTRQPQSVCMENYFNKELEYFINLKLLITFGSHPYPFIKNSDLDYNDKLPNKFFDYFYDLLIENITHTKKVYNVKLINKIIPYLALPHPSNANSMHMFLDKMDDMISSYINIAKK